MSAFPSESTLVLRRLHSADLPQVGEVLYRSFNEVFARHGYPPPILSATAGESLVVAYHEYDPGSGLLAVQNGRIVGSAFYHRRGDRAGVGPVTVDPEAQGHGIGRRLMERVIDELSGCSSIRLFQDAFNHASFALYARMGFHVRDVMAVLRAEPGSALPVHDEPQRLKCREMRPGDLEDVSRYDLKATGIDRPLDLEYLRERGPALVLHDGGMIRGYASSFGLGGNLFLGPAAADTVSGLNRLVNGAIRKAGARVVTVRAPARPGALMTELLNAGFRIRTIGTYMVRGSYEEPSGVSLAALFPEML
jgi:GNAT superfamily N-acetyltransferase